MTFSTFTRPEYFDTLARAISKTKRGERIALTSMVFDPRAPAISHLAAELANAAGRGVVVHFVVDAYIFLADLDTRAPGPLWFHTDLPERRLREPYRTYHADLENIAVHGGNYTVVNLPKRPFTVVQRGRSHIKAAVINDRAFVAGCNLEKPTDIDMAIGWRGGASTDWLYQQIVRLAETGQSRTAFAGTDQRFRIDARTELLLDAGKPGQSLIMEEALRLIDQARERLFFTCQFVPHGVIADHLSRARKRGVETTIIFNNPSKHTTYEAVLQRGVKARERLRRQADYFSGELPKSHPFIHGKLIATEQGAMFGSHNYVTTGVKLGTAELSLLSHDPEFARQAIRAIKDQLTS